MQRLEVTGAVRPLQWSLGVKGLKKLHLLDSSTTIRSILFFPSSHKHSCIFRTFKVTGATHFFFFDVCLNNFLLKLSSASTKGEEIKFSVDKKNQLDVTFCILYFSSNSCPTCVVLRTHPRTHYLPTGLDHLPAATAHTNTRL